MYAIWKNMMLGEYASEAENDVEMVLHWKWEIIKSLNKGKMHRYTNLWSTNLCTLFFLFIFAPKTTVLI
jgi:hypothetical protein